MALDSVRRREMILRMLDAVVSSYMDGGTVVTVSGATVIGEATGWGVGAAGAAADEAVAVAAAAGAATAAGTGAESRAAHPSLPRKLIKEALPDGRLAASLTAVDSTMVLLVWQGVSWPWCVMLRFLDGSCGAEKWCMRDTMK